MYNEDNIMLTVYDDAAINKLITEALPPKAGTYYNVRFLDATFDGENNIDNECCYGDLQKMAIGGKVAMTMLVKVTVYIGDNPPSYSGTDGRFLFPLQLPDIEQFSKQMSLREYMGSRYDYNHRIKKNMRDFIQVYNESRPVDTE